MNTVSAVIKGAERTVDLSGVSALDAMQFRAETGQDLDLVLWAAIDQARAAAELGVDVLLLADRGVVWWLWCRQNVDPLMPFAAAAASVPMFEPELDVESVVAAEPVGG